MLRKPDKPWEPYQPIFRRPKGVDGLPVKGAVMMRRRVMGVWQYREMTEAEEADYTETYAW